MQLKFKLYCYNSIKNIDINNKRTFDPITNIVIGSEEIIKKIIKITSRRIQY